VRATAAALLAGAMLCGCGAMATDRTRPARMEFAGERGPWRVEIRSAELTLDDWSLCVADATVNAVSEVPRLETLVVEVTSASGDELLVLEPREIYLDGVGPSVEPIGPPETLVLSPGETGVMAYDPGIRAPLLAYPFTLHVTVFRDRNLGRPRSATVLLY
jgi:hypothetical protein